MQATDPRPRPGRRRKLLSVHELPLVGGSLCLDLVNTTGARESGAPRERLTDYADAVVWSRRAGILDATSARRLQRSVARRAGEAARALARVRRAREDIYRVFLPIAEGRPPAAESVACVDSHGRAARRRQVLVATGKRFELRFAPPPTELDPMLWPVIASAIELLTSDRIALLRRCAECDWLFLDESKNGLRRWCKSACGNRARARQLYQRRRAARHRQAGSA
jgi:predicted RNA-binding Zn ribbon-like protein